MQTAYFKPKIPERIIVQLQMATEIAPPEQGEAQGCIQCQMGSKLSTIYHREVSLGLRLLSII